MVMDYLDRYRRPPDPFVSVAQTLKDLYGFWLEPRDQAEFDLIERYWKIVSYRKIRRWNQLREKGKTQPSPLEKIWNAQNPWLELLEKQDPMPGKYIPIPLIYKSFQ
jgi:hypothetical protein